MPNHNLSRRNVLKAIGGSATIMGAGAGLLVATSPAVAVNFSINNSQPVTTDDGTIAAVGLEANLTAEWDGLDIPLAGVAYRDSFDVNGLSHTVYDNTNNPVWLEDFSSDGDGSDGWGGPGEHTTGPGLNGSVRADIDWRILTAPGIPPKSVESPGPLGDAQIEEPDDGEHNTSKIDYTKEVVFYYDVDGSLVRQDQLPNDDGTVDSVTAADQFTVNVGNQPAQAGPQGDGEGNVEATVD